VILGLSGWQLAVIALAVLVGAIVQGIVGLGLNLVAAPIVTLMSPQLMPVVPLFLASVYPLGALLREWREVDWPGMSWALGGRVPGTAVGVLVVAWASDRLLGVVVGVMVLLAVFVTWTAVRVPMNRGTLGGAGFLAGITGTATSIGGPPLAIVYQHAPGPQIRASLAVFFCIGALLSLAGLGVGGQLRVHDLAVACLLSPALLIGHLVAGPLRRHLDEGPTRLAVLLVCGASGALLLGRSLLG
jgi:uncharacterized membrane protein YfcA